MPTELSLYEQMVLAIRGKFLDKVEPRTWDYILVSDIVARTGMSLDQAIRLFEENKEWLVGYHTLLRAKDFVEQELLDQSNISTNFNK